MINLCSFMEELVKTCDVINVEEESKKNPNGAVVIFTQKGCPHCPEAVEETKKVLQDKLTIIEAELDEAGACVELFDRFNVQNTPSVIYFKGGEESKRITIQGRTWEDIRNELKTWGEG